MKNKKIEMNQIFGDFNNDLPVSQEGLTILFSPTSIPLQQRWRNNGLSADFMADYFATFFPGIKGIASENVIKAEVKSAVSFIANELLENAMKFSDETSPYPISIRLQMHSDQLVFFATNRVHLQAAKKFQAFIEQLMASEPSEFYLHQLEKNAESEELNDSGLGFLTMINDYQAKLGWKFETLQEDPEAIAVTTMVQLTV